MSRPVLSLCLAATLASALVSAQQAPPPGSAQPAAASQEDAPVFAGQVELVTVDVVVADKQGNPVTGLTKQDFTVLDEGQPQPIVSFEVVTRGAESAAPAAAAAARPRVSTNTAAGTAELGRTFVVFFDSLNLSPLNAQRAKTAALEFIDKGARAGDRVMLASTGGGAWWSARLPEGRDDLVAVLKGLDGRRFKDSAMDRMTDFEAMRIYQYHDAQVARRVQSRWERYGVAARRERERDQEINDVAVPGVVDPYVENRAAETYLKLKARVTETLSALDRVLKPLGQSRDRKSVLLLSEGFVYDPQEDGFRRVTESARRANAAIYFVDTRGLETMLSAYSTEFGAPIDERDMLTAIADTSREGEGANALSRDTGGFAVTGTNDLDAGIVRIGRESRTYYLLGYNPGSIPRDGRFRKLEVKVRARGLSVRARRGYYAPLPEGAAAAATRTERTIDPEMQAALDSPGQLEDIPLRLTSYVLHATGSARVQVLLAADADVSKVEFREEQGRLAGALDTLAIVARRENSEFFRTDLKVDLERKAASPAGPAWYTMVREFELPPGVYQARLVVRDAQTRRTGTVTHEFQVPPTDQLRLSTPVLTDAVQLSSTGVPNAVLLARRSFRSDRPLFCRFDVHGAATEGPSGPPRVKAGYELRRADGTVVSRAEPTSVEPTSLGSISRLLQFPPAGLAPGEYELVLEVVDERSSRTASAREPFTIVAATASR